MSQLEITLRITATTGLSIGAGGSSGTLADRSIVRDGWGRPYIPGSQLKGKARHAAEQLSRTLNLPAPAGFDDTGDSPVRRIFGSPQHRSPLRFVDLPAQVERTTARQQRLSQVRPAVAINRQRGTADDQRLLIQEVAWPGLVFSASPAIAGQLDDLAHVALLWAALRLLRQWGGGTSRGLGWADLDVGVMWDGAHVEETALRAALTRLGPGDR